MGFVKFLAVLAVIGLILFGTNPPQKRHEEVVQVKVSLDPAAIWEARKKGMDLSLSATAVQSLHYQNYWLFSTTTDKNGGRLTLGILRFVFDLRPNDQR